MLNNGIKDICKGTTSDAITSASKVSLPKKFIQVKAYAKKEHITKGMMEDGIATARVLIKACPNPSLKSTSL